MHHLITFLGKGQKSEGGYRTANYCFTEGRCRTSPFFGLALLEELAASSTPVDHILILGTPSSIWDALLSGEMQDSSLWVELGERVEAGNVDDCFLNRVAADVQSTMRQRGLANTVTLRVIPFGRNAQEQITILRQMADLVENGDRVSLDITHGFRSLPMLGLTSAMFLKQLKGATVEGIYYGALDMTDAAGTPVLRLDGLLLLTDWLTAISAFRVSGDYGLFAPLLDNADIGNALLQAGFYEKTINIAQARKHLRKAMKHFPQLEAEDPLFHLFSSELRSFTSWSEKQSFAGRQLAAAHNALETGNFMRAAALAVEACITNVLRKGTDPSDFGARNAARNTLNDQCKGQNWDNAEPGLAAYRELGDLRNSLSHGTRPAYNSMDQQKTLQSQQHLQERLSSLLKSMETIIK